MSRYVALKPLVPGERVEILEKDAGDNTIGAWYGYWNFKRQTVSLYPNVTNRYAHWPCGRIPTKKRIVSDSMVHVIQRRREDTAAKKSATSAATSAVKLSVERGEESCRPVVQIQIKF